MSDSATTRAWLSLILAPGVGAARANALGQLLGSPARWPEADDATLASAGLDMAAIAGLRRPDPQALKRCLDWLSSPEHHLITRDDPCYPPLLKRIDDPPPALFAVGQTEALVRPQVGIVGSRKATPGGLQSASDFAAALARRGFAVTSGLAAGADGAAHRGCLDAGGVTIGVCGTGPDQVYPARHRELAREMMNRGALVSALPPGTGPRPANFPARNRIISGMSLGVIVVEAGIRSGSLITARLAGEQGREVFAVPGSVHNPLARGCHRLIRDGAQLVESIDEVIDSLAPIAAELAEQIEQLIGLDAAPGVEPERQATYKEQDPEYARLLAAVGFDPTPVDEIIQRSRLTTAAVSSMLLMLELDGLVASHPGGRYSRTGKE